jgi:hypothetical protein
LLFGNNIYVAADKIACCTDSDCPSKDGRKGICESHACRWGPCYDNSNCDPGYCCETAAYSGASITITPPYGCVKEGTIKDDKYLCDPPRWTSSSQTVFDFLFSYFKDFVKRIMG